ncbi:DUF3311 domain-containing protein [Sphingobium lignivorans]|uniref:DUF3311 domain-containing protein n=1 Tax=Sphingobium lignivorans TaxID=2735886 RepID=A0ABR6NHT9_9SPHN|nr:DUF3311 domain-containing protein [Sphingobium lignivorans]MBB5986850.1 hypothetical protein [Sphingobium lignivorans]BAK67482.1 conserved hypothetical membrane protein [Sphingobium sp. SYK-6]
MKDRGGRGLRKWVNLLLLAPFIAVLWVPFYNSVEPRFFGIPYFYAYQLAWIWIGAGLTWIVYLVDWRGSDR